MASVKQEVIEMISKLPEEVDYNEIMSEIYFRQKVDKSLKQIEEGKVISHEEAKKRLSKWIKQRRFFGLMMELAVWRDYPDLTPEDITEALEYAAWLAQEEVHAMQ